MTVRMTRTDGALIQPSKGHRIALIAGSGRLPVEVAEGLERAGTPPLVIAIDGETHLPGAYDRLEQVKLPIEAFSELLPLLKRQRITHVVMAGGVSRRPPLRRIRWSVQLLRLLPRVIAALASGDNGLLERDRRPPRGQRDPRRRRPSDPAGPARPSRADDQAPARCRRPP